MEFQLDLVSQGYMGQKSYETAEKTDTLEIAIEYQKQRDQHLARWSSALMREDVDMLWQLRCRSAEQALGLPPLSRGKLTLSKPQLLEQPLDEEAVAAAKQHDQVTDLRRALGHRDAWVTGKKKKEQAERTPAGVLTPDQTAQAELNAWSTLWQPGDASFLNNSTSESSWRTGDLRNIISHCPLGKARGVDRWSIGELRLLPDIVVEDMAHYLKMVEVAGKWPQDIREKMYLQLPKEGPSKELVTLGNADRLRYSPRCTVCFAVRSVQTRCQGLARQVHRTRRSACGQRNKCHERIPLHNLETFALESGCPTYALYATLDMYAGRRRIFKEL
eukprot:6489264-Amphidinium_carterae.1